MNEDKSTPWQGDWQARLKSKLDSIGIQSFEAFLAKFPGMSYQRLADELGDANLAPLQLYGIHLQRAAENGNIREAAADSLVRFLVGHLKRGWGIGRLFDLRIASAFGDWKTAIRQFGRIDDTIGDQLDEITETLRAIKPNTGWIPKGADDPLIQKAFRIGWPA